MKAALMVSALWAVASVAVLQAAPRSVVMIIVLSYVLLGAGLPMGAALRDWNVFEETAAPTWVVLGLATIAGSFVASALGGQPLLWLAEWTAGRHVAATMVTGAALGLISQRIATPEVAR